MINRTRIIAFARLNSLPMLHTERKVLAHQHHVREVVLMLRYTLNGFVYDMVLADDFSNDDTLETAIFFHELPNIADDDLEIEMVIP